LYCNWDWANGKLMTASVDVPSKIKDAPLPTDVIAETCCGATETDEAALLLTTATAATVVATDREANEVKRRRRDDMMQDEEKAKVIKCVMLMFKIEL
jgi:hypothetical protein